MHARWIVLLGWLTLAGGARVTAEEADAHLIDATAMVTVDSAWTQKVEARLAAFEEATGVRVVVEFQSASPRAEEDTGPGVYMRARSARLGLIEHGVLLVYFADEPDWRAWIGDALTPRWVDRPGTAAEFTADDSMHDAKEAWLAEAFEQARLKLAQGPGSSHDDGWLKARMETEALVDGIVKRLGKK